MVEQVKELLEGIRRLGTGANLDDIVRNLATVLKRTVKSRWVLVYFFDREQRNFTPAKGYGLQKRHIKLFRNTPLHPDKVPLLKTILRKKQSLLIIDTATSELLNPAARQLLAPVNLLAVPMVIKNSVLGALFIARERELPAFTDEEIEIIRGLVAYAALVVSHERLFEESLDTALELGRRIDIILTLDEINKAISSSLSRERIMENALASLERVINCTLLALLEETDGHLTVAAAHAKQAAVHTLLSPGYNPDISRSALEQALGKGTSVYQDDLQRITRPARLEKALLTCGIRSILAIPIIGKETVAGILLLGDATPGRFVREEAFTVEKIAAQLSVALGNARLYDELHDLFIGTVTSLANAIDAKSPWTKGHSERVMRTAAVIARELGCPDEMVNRVRLGGLLHDVGKIGIIEAILEKPATLSDEEFPPMRLHPEKGVAILAPIDQLREVLPGIRHHHERYDGSGYPAGLKGDAIPLEARIITVADAFDAMVAKRPYKKGYSVPEALRELRTCAGTQFDPQVVECFIRYMERKLRSQTGRKSMKKGEKPE